MTSKLMGAILIYLSFLVHASASMSEEDRDEFDEGVAAVEETESQHCQASRRRSEQADSRAPVLVKDTVAAKGDKNILPSEAISEDFAAPLPTDI